MNGLHDGRQRLANDRDTAGVNETKNDRRRESDQDDEYRNARLDRKMMSPTLSLYLKRPEPSFAFELYFNQM